MSLFHERFRNLKDESGKTQVQIANDLGIKQQAVSYYVNGREPDYDTLIAIAKYFDVSLDYLLGVSDCKEPENEPISKKIGLSEHAIKVLSGEDNETEIFYEDEIRSFVDHFLCSQRICNLIDMYTHLIDTEWIELMAKDLTDSKRWTILANDPMFAPCHTPERTEKRYLEYRDFVIAAAERQFSEEIIAFARGIREENEKA